MSIKRLDATDEYVFETHRHRPLQVTRWSEKRISLAFAGTSSRLLIPAGAVLIEIVATQDCYINFGDVTVVASSTIATDGSRLYMAGTQVIPVPLDAQDPRVPFTYIAVIQESVAGIFQVEELE